MASPDAHATADESQPRTRRRGIAFWYASFFGAGLSPFMPGTVGSAASLVLWAPVVMLEVPAWARLALVVVIFALGVPAATRTQELVQKKDPGVVVIDEVAGQGLTLLICGPNVASVVLGFFLFRAFDIVKPWPASWADRMHTGFGIMLDDLFAGGYALLALYLLERFAWPWLGLA